MDSSHSYLLFLFTLTLIFLPNSITASSNITAIFAFGDSILDSGNNNALPTICRANHLPYGIDFPSRIPTGRFTDGKLVTDFLISDLGIKELLPAYLDPSVTNQELLTGVSFASACTGLDDLTAAEVGVLSLTRQLMYFQQAILRIRATVGLLEANRIVENALFVVAAGTNDMIDNFYGLPLRNMYSLSGYQNFLLNNLEIVITKLHNMGAKKLAVMGLPPVGCLPVQVTMGSLIHMFQRECITEHNSDSQAYNTKLQAMISRLQTTLPGVSKIVYVDIYTPIMDMITKPTAFGLDRALEGCCGSGMLEMGILCNEAAKTCSNSSNYLFWDAAHPTQAAYKILANQFLDNVLPSFMS